MSEDELRNIFNELIDKELDENFLCGYSYRQWQKPEAIEQRKITGFEDFKLGYNLANNLSKQIEKLQAENKIMREALEFYSVSGKYHYGEYRKNGEWSFNPPTISNDCGETAREALKKVGE